jgi:murein DD-endopeptidase MepM/ murein hydrolase activator NlpD
MSIFLYKKKINLIILKKKLMIRIAIILGIFIFILSCHQSNTKKIDKSYIPKDSIHVETTCVDSICSFFLGINVDSFYIENRTVNKKDVIQKIFKNLNFSKKDYKLFSKQLLKQQVFQGIKPKQNYFIFSNHKDSSFKIHYIAFELNQKDFMLINCADSFKISMYEKNVDTIVQELAFVVESKIIKTLKYKNIDVNLIEKINHVFSQKISTHQLKNGDTLRVIYDELYIAGNFFNIGDIDCASISTKKKQYFITDFFNLKDSTHLYIDENGKYNRVAFLKSPVSKVFIVSRYNLERFHPILLEVRPHLGTDFAAPHGTPILATAAGIVEAATYSENNGNYVKIKHDRVYSTQYLHMSKFAKNLRVGQRVRQGEVIGYVGSTGLSTGSHVCYRFWKNGVQVDPFKEKLNVSTTLPKDARTYLDSIVLIQKNKLNNIVLK